MSKTLGLALGSGGARGVAHIGFIKALEEAGIKIDYISGCSMGAVIGGCYASGIPIDKIKEIALSLKSRDVIDVSPAIITKLSLLRSKKIYKLLHLYFGDKKLEEFEIPFTCVATDLLSGRLHTFKDGSAVEAILSSSSIPTVFRPVKADGKMFVDGGCLCRVPVKQVKEMGADVVIAVDALKNTAEPVEKLPNIIRMILRVFDVMDNNQTEQARALYGDMCDMWVEPEMKGMSQYVIKDLERAYSEGYEAGKANAEKIKSLLGQEN